MALAWATAISKSDIPTVESLPPSILSMLALNLFTSAIASIDSFILSRLLESSGVISLLASIYSLELALFRFFVNTSRASWDPFFSKNPTEPLFHCFWASAFIFSTSFLAFNSANLVSFSLRLDSLVEISFFISLISVSFWLFSAFSLSSSFCLLFFSFSWSSISLLRLASSSSSVLFAPSKLVFSWFFSSFLPSRVLIVLESLLASSSLFNSSFCWLIFSSNWAFWSFSFFISSSLSFVLASRSFISSLSFL